MKLVLCRRGWGARVHLEARGLDWGFFFGRNKKKHLLGLGGSEDESSGGEGGKGVVVGGREEAGEDEEAEEDKEAGKEEGVVEGGEGSGFRGGGRAHLLSGLLGGLLLLNVLLIQRRVGLRARRQQALVHAHLGVAERDEQQTDGNQSDHGKERVVLNSLQLVDRVEQVCEASG